MCGIGAGGIASHSFPLCPVVGRVLQMPKLMSHLPEISCAAHHCQVSTVAGMTGY